MERLDVLIVERDDHAAVRLQDMLRSTPVPPRRITRAQRLEEVDPARFDLVFVERDRVQGLGIGERTVPTILLTGDAAEAAGLRHCLVNDAFDLDQLGAAIARVLVAHTQGPDGEGAACASCGSVEVAVDLDRFGGVAFCVDCLAHVADISPMFDDLGGGD